MQRRDSQRTNRNRTTKDIKKYSSFYLEIKEETTIFAVGFI